jgi:hypothetical protein
MPTLVHILNKLGVTVDVFCPERLRRNDPFVHAKDLRYEMRNSEDLFNRKSARDFRDFDLVIINSLEPRHILTVAGNLSLPVIGVMHNAGLITTDQDYADFFSAPKRQPLVLARHISAFLANRISAQWMAPLELGHVERKQSGQNGPVVFCVQGNVQFERRNYSSLLEAVERLHSRGIENFLVKIIGRNDWPDWPDGKALKTDIANRSLEHLFEFSEGELPYRDYYGTIAGADYLLPLVDRNFTDHAAYFEDKLSTSMQLALAFQVIPIVDADLAEAYEVMNASITYSDDLERAMLNALEAGEERLSMMRNLLLQKRTEFLEQSANNLRSLIEELGLRVPCP